MGTTQITRFAVGGERNVAHFGWGQAAVFYQATCAVERLLNKPSGVSDADECATYWIDAGAYIRFCDTFYKAEWLHRHDDILREWMRYAGGILENITLSPCGWTDENLEPLPMERYTLDAIELESQIQDAVQKGRVAAHSTMIRPASTF